MHRTLLTHICEHLVFTAGNRDANLAQNVGAFKVWRRRVTVQRFRYPVARDAYFSRQYLHSQ